MAVINVTSYSFKSIYRYAFGSTLMVALAMGYDWELSFLLPVLGLDFLSAGKQRPSLKEGLIFITTIALASVVGMFFSYFFLNIPIIHILLTFLLLLWVFYTNSKLISPMVKVWLIIAVLLIPNVALLSIDLAGIISGSLVINAALAILVIWFTFSLFPKKSQALPATAQAPGRSEPTKIERYHYALTNTLVIMPVYLVFYYFEMSSYVLALIFIALLSMQPAFTKDFKGGLALIKGNLIGGFLSILVYEIITVVPVYGYFLLLVLLVGFIMGSQVFSKKKTARLYGMAFSTFLLIICSVTSLGVNDASSKLWSRVIQIMLAVIYVVSAFGLINRFKNAR